MQGGRANPSTTGTIMASLKMFRPTKEAEDLERVCLRGMVEDAEQPDE